MTSSGQNKMAPVPGAPVAPAAPGNYSEALSKMLMGSDQRQYNLEAVKQRVEGLYKELSTITAALQNISQPIMWNDVLDKFVLLSIQYGSIMQQLRGTLKNAVVHPKLVDSSIMSSVLPLQLSTFPLPEMQLAEADLTKRVQHELQTKTAGQACLQLHDAIDKHNDLVDFLTLASNTDAAAGVLDPQGKGMKELKATAKRLTAQINETMSRRAAAGGAGGVAGGARKGQAAGKVAAAKRKRDPQEDLVDMFLVGHGLKGAPAPQQVPATARR